MPTPVSYKLGPGTLKFDAGLATETSIQVTDCEVEAEENVTVDDDLDVLSGDVLAGDETIKFTWKLSATIIQDISAAGFVTWSWTNAGVEKAFEFIPNTVTARKVTGTIMPVPIKIGGKAKTRPTSDFTWRAKNGTAFALAAVV